MALPVSFAACWLVVFGDAGIPAKSPNSLVGTQEIYCGDGPPYNFTKLGILEEQAQAVIEMGGNQFKMRLEKTKTCNGYGLQCDDVNSLRDLVQVPEVAATLAKPGLRWYHFWFYSFVNNNWKHTDWTHASLDAEYTETKEWALYMLETYEGTGKVFMAGNWEGDNNLLGMSDCKKPSGGYNKSCPIQDFAVERMVQWGRIRQKAIDDAVVEAQATGVTLLYYMEFNVGDQALEGKKCVVNSVLPVVNPDLASYSSYDTTSAFKYTGDELLLAQTEFKKVMTLAESKLQPKTKPELTALGFTKRTFVGEFGSKQKTDGEVVRYTTRVINAALQWGAPFVLYWELCDGTNSDTVPILPESGAGTPLWHLFNAYFDRVRSLPPGQNKHIPALALDYFTPLEGESACDFNANTETAQDPAYADVANSQTECCDLCSQDPTCKMAIFKGNDCFVHYETGLFKKGAGTACVKKDRKGKPLDRFYKDYSLSERAGPAPGGYYTAFTAVIAKVFALLGVAGAARTCMRKASGLDVARREATLLDSDSGEAEDV